MDKTPLALAGLLLATLLAAPLGSADPLDEACAKYGTCFSAHADTGGASVTVGDFDRGTGHAVWTDYSEVCFQRSLQLPICADVGQYLPTPPDSD